MNNTLVQAASGADAAVLRELLDSGADPNATDVHGNPLLIVAQMADRWENVQLLIERGADINACAADPPGLSVLWYYTFGTFERAFWLLERGADPGYRVRESPTARPERVGTQPLVERIFWWPVDELRDPVAAHWQRKCQDLLAARGFHAPPVPEEYKQWREEHLMYASTIGT